MPSLLRCDHARRAASAASWSLGGCATNPVDGRQGRRHDQSRRRRSRSAARCTRRSCSSTGATTTRRCSNTSTTIGQRIAAKSHRPTLHYTFTVLDSDEVNAFALPGGYVYITRGIMAYLNSEAELDRRDRPRSRARHGAARRPAANGRHCGRGRRDAGRHPDRQRRPGQCRQHGRAGPDQRVMGATWSSKPTSSVPSTSNRVGYEPEAMIDVVRLLKNQEMLEVQMARRRTASRASITACSPRTRTTTRGSRKS